MTAMEPPALDDPRWRVIAEAVDDPELLTYYQRWELDDGAYRWHAEEYGVNKRARTHYPPGSVSMKVERVKP